MTGRIAEEKIREIRERTDIVEVISSYLPLRRSGANHLGLCPFHGEKTPSFNVNATRQIFHCFGCGVGGNVFSFLMRMEGLSFPETARRLGERVGIDIEEHVLTPAEERERREREELFRINEAACAFYHQHLLDGKEGAPARRYLRERGFDGETARQFRLGFAPDRWEALAGHLAAQGFDPRWARELGLIQPGKKGRGDFDLFRGRLLFPISDLQGRVAAFGGRVLDSGEPKYLNSPESRIYHKSGILFGMYQAREAMRQRGEGIVVEGYFDQLALHRAGFPNAVATCGTALTPEHARLLKRYAGRLLLLFDQDSAGQKATFRGMDVLLAEGVSASVVALDPGEDPDSFLRRREAEEFGRRLAAARPVLEVFIERTLASHGETIEGRARAVEEILPRLRKLASDIERQLYVKSLGTRTGLDEELLRRQVAEPGSARTPAPGEGPRARGDADAPPGSRPPRREQHQGRRPEPGGKSQDWLLFLLLHDEKSRRRVMAEGVDHLFADPVHRLLAEAILEDADGKTQLDPGGLLDRLDEEQKALLSGILIHEGKAFASDTESIFEGCRQAAARDALKRRSRDLPALIRQAEQAGDERQRAALQSEQVEINRRLKSRN
jgi:DNA primase